MHYHYILYSPLGLILINFSETMTLYLFYHEVNIKFAHYFVLWPNTVYLNDFLQPFLKSHL